MRLKLTLILFILNVLVFGLILFLEKKPDEGTPGQPGSNLMGAVVLQAERLVIEGADIESRVLEKTEDGRNWKLLTPSPWPANLFAVTRILNQLQFLEEEVSFSVEEIRRSGQTLADYGLENPNLTLTLEAPNQSARLKIGSITEMGNRLYLLGPDEKTIFVVDRKVLESLLVSLGKLRNSRIFEIPVFEVRSLNMRITEPGDVTIRLARDDETWVFEAPLTAAADPTLVNTTIKELTGIEAHQFFEPGQVAPEVSGLDNPTRRVTLEGNARRQTLLLGNEVTRGSTGEKQVFAKLENNPTIVTVPARPFEELFEAQQKLRDPTVFRFQPDRLNTIEIEHAGKEVTVQRLENGSWQVLEVSPDGLIATQSADPDIMLNLINALRQLEAAEFVSDAPSATALEEEYGLTDPQWTLTLTTTEQTLRLDIGQLYRRPNKDLLLYARREGSSTVYGLDQRILSLLRIEPLHYRDRRLRVLPSGAKIVSMQVKDLESEQVILEASIDPEEESWAAKLETLDLTPQQRDGLLNLRRELRTVEVAGYLVDTFTRNYLEEEDKVVPWSFLLTVEIVLTGGEANQTETENYYLTERLSGNFVAGGSPEFNLVFRLNQAMIQALHPFIFTREPPEEYNRPQPAPLEDPGSESNPEEEETSEG